VNQLRRRKQDKVIELEQEFRAYWLTNEPEQQLSEVLLEWETKRAEIAFLNSTLIEPQVRQAVERHLNVCQQLHIDWMRARQRAIDDYYYRRSMRQQFQRDEEEQRQNRARNPY